MPEHRTQMLLLAGRSGVGKSTVSYEVSELLRRRDVSHALVDGDNLDDVYPEVEGSALAEANLAAIWRNYQALGHHRVIYVNTVSVLEDKMIRRALGADVDVTGILLTASDATVAVRLGRREVGSTLDFHLERSAAASVHLDVSAATWVHRLSTDGRSVHELASSIIRLSGWADE